MLSLVERFRHYERILSYPDPYGDLARLRAEFWANTSQVPDRVPVKPGQQCGTRLGKRSKAMFKLEADDVEAARRLSKLTGYTFEECLKAYSDVNEMNTPSYEGGTLIQKKGETKSAVGAGIWTDRLAVQAENQRAHVQYGIEMVKAARSRPIAFGDHGVISMMRHGRP